MSRYPINLPDGLMAEIAAHCLATSAVRSKLFSRWIEEGFRRELLAPHGAGLPAPVFDPEDTGPVRMFPMPVSFERVDTEPPVELEPNPATGAQAAGEPASEPATGIQTMRNGAGTWFEINGVCDFLGITVEQMLQEIDPVDDVLKYANRDWIDERGIAEARSLCPVPAISDSFWAWAQTKIK